MYEYDNIFQKIKFDRMNSLLPVRNTGMLMKNPPTAHIRLMDDFCRYLLLLKQRLKKKKMYEKYNLKRTIIFII